MILKINFDYVQKISVLVHLQKNMIILLRVPILFKSLEKKYFIIILALPNYDNSIYFSPKTLFKNFTRLINIRIKYIGNIYFY